MKIKRLIFVITLFIIYIASTIGAWHITKWEYTNEWTHSDPRSSDIIIVVTPAFNTLYCLYWIVDKSNVLNTSTSRFFNIEKRL